jgi:hypothetical protein
VEFVGNVSLGDVQRAWMGAKQIDANPVRLVGRVVGLGSSEMEAGIPTWAWITVAFGAGALVTVMYGDKITRKVRSVF